VVLARGQPFGDELGPVQVISDLHELFTNDEQVERASVSGTMTINGLPALSNPPTNRP
jgi:hypothetical protein